MATKATVNTTPVRPTLPKLPVINVEALLAVHGRNVEALTQASRIVVEGAQAVGKRQAELAQANVQTLMAELEASLKAAPRLDAQVDRAKSAYQAAVVQAEELYELGAKAHKEAVAVLNARALAQFDDVSQLAA